MSQIHGIVYLVGAGPGGPGLITVRGRTLLRRADVVVYDRLIGKALLAQTHPDAELINAGKAPGMQRLSQEAINTLLVDRARRGQMVVRLKGGDPFVFGRGFEEMMACRQAGIPCVVVPGVSSALAAPASAGIPLTHRGAARSFAVLTAQTADDVGAPPLDYHALAALDTLVIMMGRENLHSIADSLIEAGRDPTTPAACVEWATTPLQRCTVATLGTIAAAVERDGLQAPLVTVVGRVAEYATSMAPPSGPLAGKRIVITRPISSSQELFRVFQAAGANAVSCPLIRIAYPKDLPALDDAIARLDSYDWIVFTSQHGVRAFWKRLTGTGRDARAIAGCRVAAIGPATARALARKGITADFIARPYTADALIAGLQKLAPIGRILVPRADIARRTVADGLRRAGAVVDDVVAYHTVGAAAPAAVRDILRKGVDAVVFCSPSAVRQFRTLQLDSADAAIACIGPVTAAAARESGLRVNIVPDEHTGQGLVNALTEHYQPESSKT